MKRFQTLSILLAIVFSAWIIIDLIINDYLEDLNISFTNHLQTNYASWQDVFMFFTRLGADFGIMCISLLCYAIPASKIKGVKLLFLGPICLYMQGTLKMIYAQPRPYMLHTEIHAYSCIPDFGRPSGHALSSTVVFLMIYHYYIHEKEDETTNFKTTIWNYLSLILVLCVIAIVCLSRIFLGVHSLGQILLGLSYGMLLYLLYINCVDDFIDETFRKYSDKTLKVHNFTTALITFGVGLTTPLVIYCLMHNNSDYDALFDDIKKVCPGFKVRNLTFYENHVVQTTIVAYIFGYFTGYIVSSDTEENVKPEQELSFIKEVVRVAVIMAVTGAPVLMFVKETFTFTGLWANYFGGSAIFFFFAYALAHWIPYGLLAVGLGRSNEYLVWEYTKPHKYESVSTVETTADNNA